MGVPPGRAYVSRKMPAINRLHHWTMGHLDDTKDSAGHWNSSRGASIAAGPQKQNGATAISEGAKYLLTIHAISVAAHGGFVNGEANAGPPNKVQARSVHRSRGRSGSHMPVMKKVGRRRRTGAQMDGDASDTGFEIRRAR
jgi:hypothetical protein